MKKIAAVIALAMCVAPVAYAAPGGSCAEAIPLTPGTITVDTTGATQWISAFGPLGSPSNDVAYTFTTGADAATGTITPTGGSYPFAVYVLNSCTAGAGPTPIGATGTAGNGIALTGITNPSTQYWVVVTGTAAGGPGANGTVTH